MVCANFSLLTTSVSRVCQNFGGGSAVTADKVWAFYQKVIPWLDSQDFVTAYFPFGTYTMCTSIDMRWINWLSHRFLGGHG